MLVYCIPYEEKKLVILKNASHIKEYDFYRGLYATVDNNGQSQTTDSEI